MTKTVFITCYHGFISRNIFNTDVLKILRKHQNITIVLFVPSHSRDFIQKHYGGENIIIEGVDFDKIVAANKFWYRLSFLLENSRYVKDQRKEHLWRNKTIPGYLNYWWLSSLSFVLSKLPLARSFYRFLDFRFSPQNAFDEYFEKYNPNLIFATDIFGETDALLIRQAKYRNIPVIGMVRSWDNTTTKGILGIIPERIVVNSPVVKEELIKIHGCKPEIIFIAGLPQFDTWLSGPTLSRQEFFAKIVAEPQKRLILFAPAGNILSDTDWQLCQILKEAMDNGSLPSNLQILLRNHPQHPADLLKFEKDRRFIIENPGSISRPGDYKGANLSPQESEHLRNSVYYSEIIMYVATSLGLDASIFNKPQILVSFDGFESKPYIKSVKRYNREDCLYNLISLGGTKVVQSGKEWVSAINDYLENPLLDQVGRDEAVKQHLYKIDGKAGERIANFILDYLK